MRREYRARRAAGLPGRALLMCVVAAGCGSTKGHAPRGGSGGSPSGPGTGGATSTGGAGDADAGIDLASSGGATGSGGGAAGGGAGAVGTPPDAGDGGADSRGDSGTGTLAGIHEYCEAWTKTVCGIEIDCCRARGFQVSADWCPTPSVPSYFFQQPRCIGKLDPSANFDPASAKACVDIQPQLFASCGPARRDSTVHPAALASCENVASRPLPRPGQNCVGTEPCAAPAGLVSVCYYEPGSGGISQCSQAMTPQPEGQRCGDAVGCAEGLVCGPTGTCTPPLADGQTCVSGAMCRSGSCNGQTCGTPPPVADSRCTSLEQLARHGLYMNVGNGLYVTVTRSRLVWLGYYGPRGEFLHHAPKDGSGPVVHLTPTVVHASANLELVADDEYVYDLDKGVVGRVALTNGSRATVADVGFPGQLKAKDGNDLIVVADHCNRLARVSVVDGSVALHPGKYDVNQYDQAPSVAIDDRAVYCLNGTRITRFGRDGSFSLVTTAAVSSLGWTTSPQAFGGRLYYWPAGDSVTDKGVLRSLDLSTGTISLVTPPSAPTSLTIADSGKGVLFWATAGGIQQYAPASGAATLIPTPVGPGYQLTLDAAYFYWIKGDGVFRWPRP